jgi:tRNA A-37 threonylcarbamoyl transferase component Bud32
MEWINGLPLDVYMAEVFQRADVLKFLADLWLKTVGSLRTAGVAHGDLQHGNIIIQNGNIRLVDLDGPRWPPENRPLVATSKPANEAKPEQEYL